MESDQNRPQADHAQRPPADTDAAFAGEPDFSGFKPDVRESLLPRWLHMSLLWVLGLGAAAALAMGGIFVTQQRETDKTLELLAVSSRASVNAPAVPVTAPPPEKKPTDLVFLQPAPQSERAAATPPARATPAAAVAPAVAPARAAVAATVKKRATSPLAAKQGRATRPGRAAAHIAKAAPAKAKQIAKKKKPKRNNATVLAKRGETRTWPRRRGDSITERLNAAVAACRARPHAPGDCNLRACDILGSSDPACR